MKILHKVRPLTATVCMGLMVTFSVHAQQNPWAESYRLEAMGKYAEAQTLVEPLAARQAAHEFATLRSAWLLYLQGKYVEAERRYLRAAEINPRSIEAWLGAMLPQMAHYLWADAIKSGEKVIEMSPWDYTAHVRIMACEEALSRWSLLATHAAALAVRYPADATALVYSARAAAALRDMRKARDYYAQVLERFTEHVEAKQFMNANP